MTKLKESAKALALNDFERARSILKPLEKSNSGAVHFNLALAEKGLNNEGLAIAHLEQAAQLNPGSEVILRELAFLRSKQQVSSEGAYFWIKWAELKNQVDLSISGFSAGLLVCLFIGTFLVKMKNPQPIRWSFGILSGFAILFFTLHFWVTRQPWAVITSPTATLRQGPSITFKPRWSVPVGKIVKIVEEETGWKKIEYSDDTQGWVPIDEIYPLAMP